MIDVVDLGLLGYERAMERMQALHAALVQADEGPKTGTLLVVEHPPVVTMGLRNREMDMLVSPDALREQGIDFAHVDRGGSVTVHEPGQLVVYPVVRLGARPFSCPLSVREFVHALEESMISTCAYFGIEAARDSVNPGVWVGMRKVGALGIRISERVSKHGLAFNVNNSLDTFSRIVPCGLHGRGVVSLARLVEEREGTARNERRETPFRPPSGGLGAELGSRDFFERVKRILTEDLRRRLDLDSHF